MVRLIFTTRMPLLMQGEYDEIRHAILWRVVSNHTRLVLVGRTKMQWISRSMGVKSLCRNIFMENLRTINCC